MDDLQELRAFLAQRVAELGSGAGEALSAALPQAVQARLPCLELMPASAADGPPYHWPKTLQAAL